MTQPCYSLKSTCMSNCFLGNCVFSSHCESDEGFYCTGRNRIWKRTNRHRHRRWDTPERSWDAPERRWSSQDNETDSGFGGISVGGVIALSVIGGVIITGIVVFVSCCICKSKREVAPFPAITSPPPPMVPPPPPPYVPGMMQPSPFPHDPVKVRPQRCRESMSPEEDEDGGKPKELTVKVSIQESPQELHNYPPMSPQQCPMDPYPLEPCCGHGKERNGPVYPSPEMTLENNMKGPTCPQDSPLDDPGLYPEPNYGNSPIPCPEENQLPYPVTSHDPKERIGFKEL